MKRRYVHNLIHQLQAHTTMLIKVNFTVYTLEEINKQQKYRVCYLFIFQRTLNIK